MAKTPLKIVVSNDDGIEARGLETLVSTLAEWGECRVVAPAGPQSGVGHSLTYDKPIEVRQVREHQFAVSGSPADCARLALSQSSPLLEEWADARREGSIWLISGINHGANLGLDLYPSGTAAAAREAAILGFPSIAISQYSGRFRRIEWSASAQRARQVLSGLLHESPPEASFWNINLPHPQIETAPCDVVHCSPDPSAHVAKYSNDHGGRLVDESDYHDRPRLPGHDIDICFRGDITVSKVGVQPKHF